MKKRILTFIIPILILIIGVSVTYAWYTWNTTSEDETVLITTGVGGARVVFIDGSDITTDNLLPTATKEEGIVKKVYVKATEESTFNLTFNLYLDVIDIEDGLNNASYKYELYKNDTKIKEGNFSDSYLNSNLRECTTNNSNHIVLKEGDTITTTLTTYTLYLWIDGNMENPLEMSDKLSQFKLHASGENATLYEDSLVTASVDGLYDGYSCDSSTSDCTLSFLGSNVNREEITSITFVDNNNVPETALGSIDVSQEKDKSIMLWYNKNTENSTDTEDYYDVYIGGKDGKVYISDGSYLFYGLTNVETIDFGNVVDTTPMTSMYNMFNLCSNLTTLDLSSFNTSNVTNMRSAFQQCYNLTSLDVSDFDTSNVITMRSMFGACTSLESLDLSKWNVSNVTTMRSMFMGSSTFNGAMSLKTVGDLSGWDTSKVTNMEGMFQLCSNLESLNISKWNVSNVTNMKNLFYICSSLTELNLSGWNTNNVTDMSGMFGVCSSLKELDLSNFDTTNVTNMRVMFRGCSNLTTLDLNNFDTSNVTNMELMFLDCSKLQSIYVSDLWNVSAVTASTDMFTGCTSLVGGSDTTYNASYTDKTYARVDGGTESPGYFTYKAANV